jgi:hypothetical protein
MSLSQPIYAQDWREKLIKKFGLAALALGLLIFLLSPVLAQGQTQGQITVSSSEVQVDYPLTINFASQIKSSAVITDVRLCYQIELVSFAQVFSEVIIEFTPSAAVKAKYSLDLRKIGTGGVPPGTNINYWWKVRDKSGAKLETTRIKYQVDDTLHKWQSLKQGKINVYFYSGGTELSQAIMSAAQQALVKLDSDTGVTPEKPVNIYAYASSQDYHNSTIFEPEWSGGLSFSQFSTISIIIRPGQLALDISGIPHELTHTVIYQVTANPYSGLPVWLNEGLAMYSEGTLGPQFATPLKKAIQGKSLISVRSLSDPFSAIGDQAYLSYAQSFSLMDYLLSQYGQAKMLELLHVFQKGSEYDAAFQQTYGFDLDKLNDQWKTWVTKLYTGG